MQQVTSGAGKCKGVGNRGPALSPWPGETPLRLAATPFRVNEVPLVAKSALITPAVAAGSIIGCAGSAVYLLSFHLEVSLSL